LADPNQNTRDQNKREISGDIHVRGEVETKFPPDLAKQRKTDRKEDKADAKKRYVVELLTLAAVVIYAGVAGWQGCMTREVITTSKQQFREQQRPYLWPVSGDWQMPPSTSSKQNATVHVLLNGSVDVLNIYQNYGASPAIIVRWTGDTEIGADALQKLHANQWKEDQSVMPPGRSDMIPTPYSRDRVSIPPKGGPLAAYTKIQYRDVTGHLFESDWCFFTEDFSQPTPFTYCPSELNRTRLIDCEKEACEK
jgi:hypothetical protein